MKMTYNTKLKKAEPHFIANINSFVTVDPNGEFNLYFIIHISKDENIIFNVAEEEEMTSHSDEVTVEDVLDIWNSYEQLVAINDEISIQVSF